jgi:hypothetical protein
MMVLIGSLSPSRSLSHREPLQLLPLGWPGWHSSSPGLPGGYRVLCIPKSADGWLGLGKLRGCCSMKRIRNSWCSGIRNPFNVLPVDLLAAWLSGLVLSIVLQCSSHSSGAEEIPGRSCAPVQIPLHIALIPARRRSISCSVVKRATLALTVPSGSPRYSTRGWQQWCPDRTRISA